MDNLTVESGISETMDRRVAKGIAYLESRGYSLGGIDIDTIDIADTNTCVIGQMFGSFTYGRQLLGLTIRSNVCLGFLVRWTNGKSHKRICLEHKLINESWKRALISKRSQ